MSQLRPIPIEPLDGAIALVTGAGQGIGLATAFSLYAAGAKVIAGYYQPPLASLPAEIDQIRKSTGRWTSWSIMPVPSRRSDALATYPPKTLASLLTSMWLVPIAW
jgi:NAD(P)-dependent dehydrogenase (short-subunit alcohol dehydrogenase family)